MYKLENLKTPVDYPPYDLPDLVVKRLNIPREVLESVRILRRSLDARKKPDLVYVYTLALALNNDALGNTLVRKGKISRYTEPLYPMLEEGSEKAAHRIVVAGTGPAGLFCGYLLAEYGYRPLLIERGGAMAERVHKVETFWREGVLDLRSNAQFGEGGAGTFSDGKLTTRSRDERVYKVLQTFIENGAPEEIAYLAKPHLGTDRIRRIVVQMRHRIEELGGEFLFDCQLTDLKTCNGQITEIEVEREDRIPVSALVMATGHSARDTYRMLQRVGVQMEQKPFAVGLRIEHPQSMLDANQYGDQALAHRLGAAEYKLTWRDEPTGRGVYSFCMCPGGEIIGAASEQGRLCTNGMSHSGRSDVRGNAALVVTVKPDDFPGEDPLAGVTFQEALEEKAYALGGGGFYAPAQRASDFLAGTDTPNGLVSSYRPGVRAANLRVLFPGELTDALVRGLEAFDRQIPGFGGSEALLVGVESRTSSPLRVVRKDGLASETLGNLYPAGEGAGYAGGIVSAAVDGLKVAEQIIKRYRRT